MSPLQHTQQCTSSVTYCIRHSAWSESGEVVDGAYPNLEVVANNFAHGIDYLDNEAIAHLSSE